MAEPTPSPHNKIVEIILAILSFKREFDSENLIDEVKKRIDVLIWLLFSLLTFLILLLFVDEINLSNFYESLKHQSHLNWVWIVFSIITISAVFILLFGFRIKTVNFKKSNKNILDKGKFVDSSIISRIDLLEGNINLNFKHSQKFFESIIKKYIRANDSQFETLNEKSYERFVMEFKSVNRDIEPEELITIPNEIQKSANGCFYCVISYEAFFKDEKQAIESIQYFASFYKGTERNFVQRIFTVPGKGTELTTYKIPFESAEEMFKSRTLLKYLIVNKISSVETYLLVYDSGNRNNIQSKFFTHADYVIAMPSICQNENQNKLFFAYPEGLDGKDRVVVTTDSYLIQLMKKDFDYRIDKLDTLNLPLNIVELHTSSYDDILKMLGFNLLNPEHISIINKEIDNLSNTLIEMSQEHSYYDAKTINKLLSPYKKCQIRYNKKPQSS